MTLSRALWLAGGYLVGTFPSTFLVAKAKGALAVIAASRREVGEADAHVVMGERLGGGWAALAATLDVAKAIIFVVAARRFGDVPEAWLALVAVAVVVGHSFPFYSRDMAGRGLAATAGVYLVLLPVPMIVGGLTMVVGFAVRSSGLFSTIGFGSVPAVAALQGQPAALVAMSAAIFVVIVIRRLEGVGDVVRSHGISWRRAALYRAVFDSSGPPDARGLGQPRPEEPPA